MLLGLKNVEINAGMKLLVPDVAVLYPIPDVCEDSSFYGCYTVKSGDTLFKIA